MKRWPTKPLGEFVEERTERLGKTSATIYSVTNERGFVRSLDLFDKQVFSVDTGNYKRVGFHDLAYNPSRVNVGSVAMCEDKDGGAVSPMYVIVHSKPGLLPHYLLRFLKSEAGLHQIRHRCEGAVRFQLKFRDLCAIPILAPPLTEQERIVKVLDEADELRKLRTQANRRTAALIPAIFHEMFGDPNFPKVALRELATKERNSLTNGPFGSDLLSSELTDSGVPVIYIRDISSGSYERKSTVCVTPAKAIELEFCNAKPGDILVAKVGTPPGIAAVYPAKEPHAIVTQDVIRIRPNLERALPVYVEGFINSSLGLGEVRNITIQATRQRFSLGQFKEIKVPVPPLSLQKEFAARVSEIRAVQAEQAASRHRLDNLFQSMLHRAFNGEL